MRRSGQHRKQILLALLTVASALLTGCSSAHNAASTVRTQTVVRTVTTPPPANAAPPPKAPFSPSYQTYAGSYFNVDYPDTWSVETAEASKGAYLDTTIRSISNPDLMVRIDVTPGSSLAGDVNAAAAPVVRALSTQSGYRELLLAQTTNYQGYDSVDWRFLVLEGGVLLEKEDSFFFDDEGNGFAVLTQAPADQFARWRAAFAHVRHSLLLSAASTSSGQQSVGGSFCDTHTCIANFDNGSGYIVQCNDGMWSHSGGLPGACSYHGGESGNIYNGSGSDGYGSHGNGNGGSGAGTDLGPGNGYTVTCADGSISHSGGIQGACSHHGGVGP